MICMATFCVCACVNVETKTKEEGSWEIGGGVYQRDTWQERVPELQGGIGKTGSLVSIWW